LILVVVITILTTLTITIQVYAGGDDDDGNKQKAEDDSAAAIADCDDNDVEQAGFDCIVIAANDVEIEPPEEPPGESITLAVCKEVVDPVEPSDFDFTVTSSSGDIFSFVGVPSPICHDVPVSPGEYEVTEQPAAGVPDPDSIRVEAGCTQDPTNEQRATGEIQAGETEECTFINIYED
jgi:hypothetical protein